MRFRIHRLFSLFCLAGASAAAIQAQSLGVAVDGLCEEGSCTPSPLPVAGAENLPLSFSYTLPNGDIYFISGPFSGSSDSLGTTLYLNIIYQVTYEGNTSGAALASAADTLTLDFYESYATPSTFNNYTDDLIGAFSPSVAADSSASVCWNVASCFGPVFPYSPFDMTGTVPNTAVNGAMNFDETYTLVFGQGSLVGSYIVIGRGDPILLSPPSINGIVDAASFTTTISPGELASIFGNYLTDGSVQPATSLPLPEKLVDATVTVNGTDVPLLYASPSQINFQVPYEAPVGTSQVVVTTNTGSSNSFAMPLQATAPSLFQYNGNHAVVENADFSLNTTTNGAAPGSYLIAFGTGGGPTSNQPADGVGAPSGPLAQATDSASATINGENATVLFTGLAPGFVGLLQMNIAVPSDLAPGTYPLIITVGTASSTTAVVSIQ